MIYTSLRGLAEALDTLDMTDAAQVETFRRLLSVYMTASHNPPDGVIGVGIITYAEQQLIAAQVAS
jgi:hypothetical protein